MLTKDPKHDKSPSVQPHIRNNYNKYKITLYYNKLYRQHFNILDEKTKDGSTGGRFAIYSKSVLKNNTLVKSMHF